MVHPQVVGGGDSLQIWRIAVNILNKEVADSRQGVGPPAWQLGIGLTALHHKKINLLQNVTEGLGPGWILWINDLS
jgi:hypothetical protein